MSVQSIDERLSAYLDGELPPEQVAALEHELAHDASLRSELDALRTVLETLRGDGPVRAPLGFHAAVMERVDAEVPVVPGWRMAVRRPLGVPLQGWGVVLAAAAVLVVVQRGATPSAGIVEEGPVWREGSSTDTPSAAVVRPPGPAEVTDAMRPEAVPPLDAGGLGSSASSVSKGTNDEREGAVPSSAKERASIPADKAQAKEPAASPPSAPASPVLRAPPTGWTLRTSDPDSLREVLAVAARLGGEVTTPSGAEVRQATLDPQGVALTVRIPSGQLAAFQSALSPLGVVRSTFDKERLYSGDTLDVPLTIEWSAGGDASPAPVPEKKRRAPGQADGDTP